MNPNNLTPNNGLSLSQAQSISNLCNQRASEIGNKLNSINNFSKLIDVNGKYHIIQKGIQMPENIVDLLIEKSKLHACQAYLMENITIKNDMLDNIKKEMADISSVVYPEKPEYINRDSELLKNVSENFGWEQLKSSEYNEYLEAEAYASHIGKFIHKDSVLDRLRKELPNIPSIEWMEIETGKKTPVNIEVHHTSEELLNVHEELAKLHRKYEQRVNYYKAKVKNIVTLENARIAKHNSEIIADVDEENKKLRNEYDTKYNKALAETRELRHKFEQERQKKISEIASMRIEIDSRFQDVIDMFLSKVTE